MAVEVVWIQKIALLVGPTVHGLLTVLLTLLAFAALGSRFADRIPAWCAFGGIALFLLAGLAIFPAWVRTFGAGPLPLRMLAGGALAAPLGFFLGVPFPKGGQRVGALVDWGFAVNGAGSVLGATAVLPLAFSLGFTWALLSALALYLVAFLLFLARSGWNEIGAPPPA